MKKLFGIFGKGKTDQNETRFSSIVGGDQAAGQQGQGGYNNYPANAAVQQGQGSFSTARQSLAPSRRDSQGSNLSYDSDDSQRDSEGGKMRNMTSTRLEQRPAAASLRANLGSGQSATTPYSRRLAQGETREPTTRYRTPESSEAFLGQQLWPDDSPAARGQVGGFSSPIEADGERTQAMKLGVVKNFVSNLEGLEIQASKQWKNFDQAIKSLAEHREEIVNLNQDVKEKDEAISALVNTLRTLTDDKIQVEHALRSFFERFLNSRPVESFQRDDKALDEARERRSQHPNVMAGARAAIEAANRARYESEFSNDLIAAAAAQPTPRQPQLTQVKNTHRIIMLQTPEAPEPEVITHAGRVRRKASEQQDNEQGGARK